MSTIHANSARDAFSRLETMVLSGSVDLPLPAVRAQIASAISIVVHVSRMQDGTRKLLQISELKGYDGDKPLLDDIFRLDRTRDGNVSYVPTGIIPTALAKMEFNGVFTNKAIFSSEPYQVKARAVKEVGAGDMPVEDALQAIDVPVDGAPRTPRAAEPRPAPKQPVAASAPSSETETSAPPQAPPAPDLHVAPEPSRAPAAEEKRSVSVGGLMRRRQENRSK
jgi:hypothetical protein